MKTTTTMPAPAALSIEDLEASLATKTIEVLVAVIAPEVAAYILDHLNTMNRDSRPRSVAKYAQIMERGKWRLNGATIVFTDRGLLGDGQNRLMACRTSRKPLTTLVVFGIEASAFNTMDVGVRRDHADMLKQGAKYPRDAAIAVRWCEWLETKKVRSRPGYDPTETAEVLFPKHRDVEHWIPEARRISRSMKVSVGMVAGLLYSFEKKQPELAVKFGLHCYEGICPPEFRAVSKLGAELEAMRQNKQKGGHMHEVTRAAMFIKAWNAVRKGRVQGFGVGWEYGAKNVPGEPFPEIL